MYGVNWCPWYQKQPGFLTMAKMEPVICQLHCEPQYLGVAVNGASCEVVGKLGRTMDNTCYLVHCHNTNQFFMVGTTRGFSGLIGFKENAELNYAD